MPQLADAHSDFMFGLKASALRFDACRIWITWIYSVVVFRIDFTFGPGASAKLCCRGPSSPTCIVQLQPSCVSRNRVYASKRSVTHCRENSQHAPKVSLFPFFFTQYVIGIPIRVSELVIQCRLRSHEVLLRAQGSPR